MLLGSLFVWHHTLGSVSVNTVSSPKAEMFYWVTIMFSQTLGTALDGWTADTAGLGCTGAAIVFSALLAMVGDFLDKPLSSGGLALSRCSATGCQNGALSYFYRREGECGYCWSRTIP